MSERNFIISFIRTYRSHPCLWQLTHADYRNRFKKDFAFKELLKILKVKDKDANLCSVKKRINIMRNCFNKELNKVKRSMKRGDDNIHEPKLWYYKELRFLAEHHMPRPSSAKSKEDVLDINEVQEDIQSEDEEDFEDDDEAVNWTRGYIDVPPASHSSCSNPKQKPMRPGTFQPFSPKPSSSIITDETPQRLKYTAYGEHVGEKLRAMPELMATYCQKIINDAIFLAETNNLNMTSHVSQSNPLQGHSDMDMNRSLKRSAFTDDPYEENNVEIKFSIDKSLSDFKE